MFLRVDVKQRPSLFFLVVLNFRKMFFPYCLSFLASAGYGGIETLSTESQVQSLCRDIFASLSRLHISLSQNFVEEDRQLARKSFFNFLNSLSQSGTLLAQDDFEKFRAEGEDDLFLQKLKEGDLSFIREVTKLILSRIQEMSDCLEDQENCIALDEKASYRLDVFEPSLEHYPVDQHERRSRMVNKLRHSLFLLIGRGYSKVQAVKKAKESVEEEFSLVSSRDYFELIESGVNPFLEVLDPYSRFIPPQAGREYKESRDSEYVGIGVALKDSSGLVRVVRVIPGGPADKDGVLQPGDVLEGIYESSQSSLFTNFKGMEFQTALKFLLGQEGTDLRLRVFRPSDGSRKVVVIRRESVSDYKELPYGTIVAKEGFAPVGYLYIPRFNEGVSRRVASILTDVLKVDPATGRSPLFKTLILDLQDNGGGYFREAVALTGLFVRQGPVVQVLPRAPAESKIFSIKGPSKQLWQGNLIVVTSSQTASASEIFAGAIQDHRRGLIVGSRKTFGKGTGQLTGIPGQMFFSLSNWKKGLLKVTTSILFRPNGQPLNTIGVSADVVIEGGTTTNTSEKTSQDSESKLSGIVSLNPLDINFSQGFITDYVRQEVINRYSQITRVTSENDSSRLSRSPASLDFSLEDLEVSISNIERKFRELASRRDKKEKSMLDKTMQETYINLEALKVAEILQKVASGE